MRRAVLAMLLLAFWNLTFAAEPSGAPAVEAMRQVWDWTSRDWPKVEEAIAAAQTAAPQQRAGVYPGRRGILYLAADGRAALVSERGTSADEAPGGEAETPLRFATLAQWRDVGDGIELFGPSDTQEPRDQFPKADIEEFQTMLDTVYPGLSLEEFVAQFKHEYQDAHRYGRVSSDAVNGEPAARRAWMRLLAVEDAGGVLLLDRDWLLPQAQRWDGQGALKLQPEFWRAAGPESALASMDSESPDYALADPLHPDVPQALRGLLRPETIRARVLGRVDPEAPIPWESHRAQVQLRLDRGSEDGLIEGMALYGVAPDERWFAEVKRLDAHEAVATIYVSRFAPDDEVKLPAQGMTFTSRREGSGGDSMACDLDTSAPVRAAITAVIAPEGGPEFDADGYAYIELELDQGSAEGLAVGDELYFDRNENEDIWGEGRVRRVDAASSRVLWRGRRWHESREVEWPARGQHLVTPAWQRYESEVFGALGK